MRKLFLLIIFYSSFLIFVGTAYAQTAKYPWPMFNYNPERTGYTPGFGPATNNLAWSYDTGGAIFSSPAVVDGRVFVGSDDTYVYALDATTGTLLWRYKTDGKVRASPAVVDGRVFISSLDNYIYALNANTGALIWRTNIGPMWGMFNSSPAVVNGVVYIGSESEYIYALNATTGQIIWTYNVGSWMHNSPAVSSGRVFIGKSGGIARVPFYLFALDTTTGNELWRYRVGDVANGIGTTPSVADGMVFVGADDGNIYALNESTGQLIWQYTPRYGMMSSPSIAYNNVYMGLEGSNAIIAMREFPSNPPTGELIWRYNTSTMVRSSPSIADGKVYIAGYDAYIYSFNATNGQLLWRYTMGAGTMSSPAIADGMLFVGSDNSNVYAIGLPPNVEVINPPTTAAPNTTVTINATISPFNSSYLIRNATLYYRINNGNWNAQAPIQPYQWSIGPFSSGDLVTYYVEAYSNTSDYGRSLYYTLTVTSASTFDFSVSLNPISGDVQQGQSTQSTITANLNSGTTQSVSFSCPAGLPSGASCSFTPISCSPTCNSNLTISTSTTTPAGTFPITVSGTGGGLNRDATYTLTVSSSVNQPPTVTATSTPSSGQAPLTVNFTSQGSDPDGTIVSYNWGFGDGVGSSTLQNPSYTYNTAGNYTATVTVTDNGGATASASLSISVSPAFYYSSWDTYTDRKLMMTLVSVADQLGMVDDSVSIFFHDVFYTKPYFQGVILVFGDTTQLAAYQTFVRNLATRADIEGYDIILAPASNLRNINDTAVQNELDSALDYIGNHTSIKAVLSWVEYSRYPTSSRDDMIAAMNNWTAIAEAHGARGGFFLTVQPSLPPGWTSSDWGKYYFFWHVAYPAEPEWALTWGQSNRPGVFGVGAGLWDYSYNWVEYNVSRYFYLTFSLPPDDYHYLTFGQAGPRLQFNSTVREWIHKYSRLPQYDSQLFRNQLIASTTDPQERVWLATNAQALSMTNSIGSINITISGTTGQQRYVQLFLPQDFVNETGRNLDKIYLDGAEISPATTESWANGDRLYTVNVTSLAQALLSFSLSLPQFANYSGSLIRNTGQTLSGNVSALQLGTNNQINSTSAINGNYILSVSPQYYDVRYDVANFFTNYWLKLLSQDITLLNTLSTLKQLTDNSNQVSLAFDIMDSQRIQSYSPIKPLSVLQDKIALIERNSLTALDNSPGWYYDDPNDLLYINFNPPPPPPCSGNPLLTLSPNPATTGSRVTPSVSSGLSNCDGRTLLLRPNSCGSLQVSYCLVSGTGCAWFYPSTFTAPSATTTYYACLNMNDDSDFTDAGESSFEILSITPP